MMKKFSEFQRDILSEKRKCFLKEECKEGPKTIFSKATYIDEQDIPPEFFLNKIFSSIHITPR